MESIILGFKNLDVQNNDSFDLSELQQNLEEIRLVTETRRIALQQIKNWILDNRYHSFPKTEKKWIKTLQGNLHLCRAKIRYAPKKIILDILNQKKFPTVLKELEIRIKNMLTDYGDIDKNNLDAIVLELGPFCCKSVVIDAEKFFLVLLQENILYRQGKRIYISPPGDWNKNKRTYDSCQSMSKRARVD